MLYKQLQNRYMSLVVRHSQTLLHMNCTAGRRLEKGERDWGLLAGLQTGRTIQQVAGADMEIMTAPVGYQCIHAAWFIVGNQVAGRSGLDNVFGFQGHTLEPKYIAGKD